MTYILKDHETAVPTMIYANQRLYWGKLVTPEAVRAATWLKMSLLPDYFTMLETDLLVFGGAQPKRLSFSETYVPVKEILALHVLPPAVVEKDYDEDEPNREMYDVTAVCGIFRFDGQRRLSNMSDFSTAIQASKESFVSLYEVAVSYPTVPAMKELSTPFVLLRTEATTFAIAKK